jgi:hypothetical protein
VSLDNFTECPTCKHQLAAALWVKFFGSIDHADLDSAPDFLSAMVPDAAVLKVVICFHCQTMKPSMEYTPEEEAALDKRNKHQQSKKALGDKFNAILGGGHDSSEGSK